jgi:hypothetical protein
MRCWSIFQAQRALDAIDSTSEVGEQLPDRFQITVGCVHRLQALSAKPMRTAHHFEDI